MCECIAIPFIPIKVMHMIFKFQAIVQFDLKKFDFAGCDINDCSLRLSSILLQVVLCILCNVYTCASHYTTSRPGHIGSYISLVESVIFVKGKY